MSAPHKPFKISELPKIQNISSNDLLLVSDYDAGKCTSKKMQVQQIANYIADALKPSMSQMINAAVDKALDEAVDKAVDDAVNDALSSTIMPEIAEQVQEAVSEDIGDIVNAAVISAMNDYDVEPKVIQTLDKMDGVEDGNIDIFASGGADAGGA